MQMLQNIDNPAIKCDILHLQLASWVSSSPGLDVEAVTRSAKRLGKTGTLALSEKLSMRKPDENGIVGMVDVVRKRQIPKSSGWTAGGYMVESLTKWECEAYTPLPSLRCMCGT